ncbi:MAG: type V CRISPR-associated protein Cas12a/Cpf1, partial [Succinivibrio sp.]
MASLTEFTNKFSKQLTIRNELLPVGNTLENIQKNGLVEKDESLNENYHQAKKIVDDFLRDYISRCLNNIRISAWNELADAVTNGDEKNIKKVQDKFRKLIKSEFENFDLVSTYSIDTNKKDDNKVDEDDLDSDKKGSLELILKKTLFKMVLPAYLKTEPEKMKIVSSFDNFSTYFRGFFENRKNIFSSKAISTSIAYRIVHDNFPKFLKNINCFSTWVKECPQIIENAEKSLKDNNVIEKNSSLGHYFSVDSYNQFLSQGGIDLYNKIIGGLSAEACHNKVQGLNEYINLAISKDNDLKVRLKNKKSLKMSTLFKQILSDKEKIFIDVFESDEQVIESVKQFYKNQWNKESGFVVILNLVKAIMNMSEEELSGIFIQGRNLNYVSKLVYGGSRWSKIRNDIEHYLASGQADKELKKKFNRNKGDLDKNVNALEFSLNELNSIVKKEADSDEAFSVMLSKKINSDFELLVKVNDGDWPNNLKEAESKQKIKAPLDALLSIYNELEIFKSNSFNKSNNFYVDFDKEMNALSAIVPLYNKSRNYCTKKEYSDEKFKLNFNCSQLAEGFSLSKENSCLTILLKKNNFYYVGILNKGTKLNFESEKALASEQDDYYEKVKYYLIPQSYKYLPKNASLSSKKVAEHFKKTTDDNYIDNDKKKYAKAHIISRHIYDIYHQTTYIKDSND